MPAAAAATSERARSRAARAWTRPTSADFTWAGLPPGSPRPNGACSGSRRAGCRSAPAPRRVARRGGTRPASGRRRPRRGGRRPGPRRASPRSPRCRRAATSTAASACLRLRDGLLDRRLLLPQVGLELGDRQLREHLPLLDRGPDVDRPVLHVAGDPRVQLGRLERLELPRLADRPADGLPFGPHDLDAGHGRGGRPPSSSEGRSHPAARAAKIPQLRSSRPGRADSGHRDDPPRDSASRLVVQVFRNLGLARSAIGARGPAIRRWPMGGPARVRVLVFLVVVRALGVIRVERGRLAAGAGPGPSRRRPGARRGWRGSRRPGRR